MLTSILWIPSLKTDIIWEQKEKSVYNFKSFTVYIKSYVALHDLVIATEMSNKPQKWVCVCYIPTLGQTWHSEIIFLKELKDFKTYICMDMVAILDMWQELHICANFCSAITRKLNMKLQLNWSSGLTDFSLIVHVQWPLALKHMKRTWHTNGQVVFEEDFHKYWWTPTLTLTLRKLETPKWLFWQTVQHLICVDI